MVTTTPAACSASAELVGGRYPFRPVCSCGWTTWGYLTREAAQNVADDHNRRRNA